MKDSERRSFLAVRAHGQQSESRAAVQRVAISGGVHPALEMLRGRTWPSTGAAYDAAVEALRRAGSTHADALRVAGTAIWVLTK